MNNDKKKIRRKVIRLLAIRNIYEKKIVDEFTQSCLDEFNLNLENGLSRTMALNESYNSLENSLDEAYGKVIKSNKYGYSLSISLICLGLSFVTLCTGQFVPDVLYDFTVLYPIILLIVLGLFVYTIITRKKRTTFDFIIMFILLIATIIINIEVLLYFHRMRTGDFYYSAFYDMPGIIRFNKHYILSVEPWKEEMRTLVILFDPMLIVSIVLSVISTVMFVIQRRKNK